MSAPTFSRLPGFRDFPPEELAVRAHVFAAWREAARRYGFLEYDGPPLESLDLYVEKSGAEIVGQLYAFTDRGDREVALRPEMTPSLARILGERSRSMAKPIRWFSIPQLFRYERQQRGRLREHFQWNVDIVGEEGVAADAEVLAVAIDALRALGLEAADLRARVSDRRLLSAVLASTGVAPDSMAAAFGVIDKIEREPRDRTRARLVAEAGVRDDEVDGVLALFEAPGAEGVRARFAQRDEVGAELERLDAYLSILDAMGLGDFVEVDLAIVRGLAYYTGIVFELFDRQGEMRAICGGGRYDRLLEFVGGEPLPAVGFGMGDVVLGDLLRERGLLPAYRRRVDDFLVAIGDEQRPAMQRLAHALRDRGRSVIYALREQSVRKQFKSAETEGAGRVLVLGPEEAARGVLVARDMATGEEREIPMAEVEAG
ncbi:MAG TPA: histidine--tRNA ligase [Longimicrobiales bacterium]|nr:histidine--tRNA ligase [Longimicrobiales bacterium]